MLEHAAPGGIRQRGERVVEAGLQILNHVVQYTDTPSGMQGGFERELPVGFRPSSVRRGTPVGLGPLSGGETVRTSPARWVYGVFGTLSLGLGVLTFVKPDLALHPESYTPFTAHLIRDQSAGGIFIGLMSFWCLFHYDHRCPVHFALVLFTALFAGIHWAGYFHASRQLLSPILNSLPFLAFVAT